MRRLILAVAACAAVLLVPAGAHALPTTNNTPFPTSTVIVGAHWISARYGPPHYQWGDILPTPWADDGYLYTLMDDGGTDTAHGGLWRNSFARIIGSPLHNLQLQPIGHDPPAATWGQIRRNRNLWSGPLGHYYSTGFIAVDHTFYATQVQDWNWRANGPFTGLAGIAYSTDHGTTWKFPHEPFPGTLGNLNWVQRGRDASAPDGYVYAIATEREFNASTLILGRARADIADMTDPAHWQWSAGWVPFTPEQWPQWTSNISDAQPILTWANHITYPRMSYDPGLRRYLLTFTYSYAATPPGIWRDGSELVILEAPHPWGPFWFVAEQPDFGPSNGYDPAFPVKWISDHGQNLWMIFAANFAGCTRGLLCSAGYGFNYQELHLYLAKQSSTPQGSIARRRAPASAPAPRRLRGVPATPPRYRLPRLFLNG